MHHFDIPKELHPSFLNLILIPAIRAQVRSSIANFFPSDPDDDFPGPSDLDLSRSEFALNSINFRQSNVMEVAQFGTTRGANYQFSGYGLVSYGFKASVDSVRWRSDHIRRLNFSGYVAQVFEATYLLKELEISF